MYVALINMKITNTNSKTVTKYEKWFRQNKDAEIAVFFYMGIKYIQLV